jgi:hypothetical protein
MLASTLRAASLAHATISTRSGAANYLKNWRAPKASETDLEPPATAAASSPYRDALQRSGINERSAERFQQLADVPKA